MANIAGYSIKQWLQGILLALTEFNAKTTKKEKFKRFGQIAFYGLIIALAISSCLMWWIFLWGIKG